MSDPLLAERVAAAGQQMGRKVARILVPCGAAARQRADHGVRSNAVPSGLAGTPMTAALLPKVSADRGTVVPKNRADESPVVAGALTSRALHLASYATGIVVEVGGGRYV